MFSEEKELVPNIMLSILVAASENNAIGKDNQLLWHLPADLKYFKQLTTGHTVIMGRKTYDAIGKPLSNRRNIVITRQPDLIISGCEVVHSLQQAIEVSKQKQEVFIIGGAEIYHQALSLCNIIYLTRVHHQFEADAYFPKIDSAVWQLLTQEDHHRDKQNKYDYSFLVYEKR